jgi:hypothetical protein
VKVYIWYAAQKESSVISAINFKNVGHVSMQVKDVYISHRPSRKQNNIRTYWLESVVQYIAKELPKYSNSAVDLFEEFTDNIDYSKKYVNFRPVPSDFSNYSYNEERQKKREADCEILITGLNEDKILDYYRRVHEMYHPFYMNCSTFIANLIRNSLYNHQKMPVFRALKDNFSTPKGLDRIIYAYPDIYLILSLMPFVFTPLSFMGLFSPLVSSEIPNFMALLINYTPRFFEYFIGFERLITVLKRGDISMTSFPVWTPTIIEFFIDEIHRLNNDIMCVKSYPSQDKAEAEKNVILNPQG